jgi:hypothetical protein
MAFPTDITLTDSASADVTYSQISLEGGKSIRTDASRGLGTPRSMIISHQTNGKGLTAVDKHLVRLNIVEEDTASADVAVMSGSVYLVIEAPRRIVTGAMIKDELDQLLSFISVEANIDKILNSEP